MNREIRIEKLQQILAHHQESWDLVMEWSMGWPSGYPYPDGKSRSDWMVSMAMISGITQQLLDFELDGEKPESFYLAS